jgi:hypothetical protein
MFTRRYVWPGHRVVVADFPLAVHAILFYFQAENTLNGCRLFRIPSHYFIHHARLCKARYGLSAIVRLILWLEGRAKITSHFPAGSFGRGLRCLLLTDPQAG